MAIPRMSCPVLWPKPQSAPSRDAFTVLRPMVNGVSACRQQQGGFASVAADAGPDVGAVEQSQPPAGSSVMR